MRQGRASSSAVVGARDMITADRHPEYRQTLPEQHQRFDTYGQEATCKSQDGHESKKAYADFASETLVKRTSSAIAGPMAWEREQPQQDSWRLAVDLPAASSESCMIRAIREVGRTLGAACAARARRTISVRRYRDWPGKPWLPVRCIHRSGRCSQPVRHPPCLRGCRRPGAAGCRHRRRRSPARARPR